MITTNRIIFSKDRGAQLDLLLRSLQRFWPTDRFTATTIIWTASSPAFEAGYLLTQRFHSDSITWVRQAEFRQDVGRAIFNFFDFTTFFVDDDIAIGHISADLPEFRALISDHDLICLSLRLCPTIDRCYAKKHSSPAPSFKSGLRYPWKLESYDWGYPMSLDGHVFRTDEMRQLIEQCSFTNPNTLELRLSEHPLQSNLIICSPHQRVVNVPANVVQDYQSRSMGYAANDLNSKFIAGNHIDLESILSQTTGTATHEELEFRLVPR